jgi:hypothetical protein
VLNVCKQVSRRKTVSLFVRLVHIVFLLLNIMLAVRNAVRRAAIPAQCKRTLTTQAHFKPAPPVGAPHVGTSEADTSEAGTSPAGTSQSGTFQAGTFQAGTFQAGTSQAGSSQACTPSADAKHIAEAITSLDYTVFLLAFIAICKMVSDRIV